jgi:hypothetical protein
MWKKSLVIFLGAAFAVLSATPSSAAGIGKVKLVKEWAYERLQQKNWDDLFIEDEVFSNQRIRTPPNAAVHVHFNDGADFRVGADSELVLDKYVYDPATGTGKIVATLGKGVFRFITGKIKDYEIRTPSATIGVRGTDFIVAVLATSTVMQVNSGSTTMTPCSTGPGRRFECMRSRRTTLVVGETAGVIVGSNVVSPGGSIPTDTGIDDDGGLAGLNPQGGGTGRPNTSFGGPGGENNSGCNDPGCIFQSTQTTSNFSNVAPK